MTPHQFLNSDTPTPKQNGFKKTFFKKNTTSNSFTREQTQQPREQEKEVNMTARKGQLKRMPDRINRLPFKARRNDTIPEPGDNIRIIPLGGVEEIGRNMTLIEYKNDIVIIDGGFKFSDPDAPGIDCILPNISYLESRLDKIRGIIITHGHLDHIGALPYIMHKMGNPPLYTRELTRMMIEKRQSEFPNLPKIEYHIIEGSKTIKMGDLSVEFFSVNHSIPDSMGVIVHTPYGGIVNPGDFKLDHTNGIVDAEEEANYKTFENQKTLLLLGESTNIENAGFSTPDHEVLKNLEEIVKSAQHRLVIGMFASHITRIIHLIKACESFGKKVVIEGRSMKAHVEIILEIGLLKVSKDVFIKPEDIENHPPHKVVILATGAQGEQFAFLMRLAQGQYRFMKLTEKDTVMLSASVVPGNETAVQKLKDTIARNGAKIVTYRTSDVYIHSTGHGNREELRWLHVKLKPTFFVPIHGYHYMVRQHAQMAREMGTPIENIIVPDTGTIIEIQESGTKLVRLKERAPYAPVMVDGFSVGDFQDVVIRDRQLMAKEGVFIVFALINSRTGTLIKSPDIISRGFVYLKENQELLRQSRNLIKKIIESEISETEIPDIDYMKELVTEQVTHFLLQKTAKRPIVIPSIVVV
jgi:ribonuclease J